MTSETVLLPKDPLSVKARGEFYLSGRGVINVYGSLESTTWATGPKLEGYGCGMEKWKDGHMGCINCNDERYTKGFWKQFH